MAETTEAEALGQMFDLATEGDIEDLLAEKARLEEKVMAGVERASRTRDGIVRLKARLKEVREERNQLMARIVEQRKANHELRVRHEGELAGMSRAYERALDRVERATPAHVGVLDGSAKITPAFVRRFNALTADQVRRLTAGLDGEARDFGDRFEAMAGPADAAE